MLVFTLDELKEVTGYLDNVDYQKYFNSDMNRYELDKLDFVGLLHDFADKGFENGLNASNEY